MPKLHAYAKRTTEGTKTYGFVLSSLANLLVPNILSVQANSIQTLANTALVMVKKVNNVVAVMEKIATSLESLMSSFYLPNPCVANVSQGDILCSSDHVRTKPAVPNSLLQRASWSIFCPHVPMAESKGFTVLDDVIG